MESCAISVGSGGTSLGALATTTSPTSELNHIDRVYGGSNNYKESAIRHFVNTDTGWGPLTKFDMYPSAPIDIFIFQDGFGEDFLNAVGEVYVPCATNHAYEIPGGDKIRQSYEVLDKFYLPSHNEIFGTTTNSPSDGTIIFPYYAEATDADRIKYAGGLATAWWTRSANRWYANRVECVDLNGKRVTKNANITAGIAVACTIVGGQHDKYSE